MNEKLAKLVKYIPPPIEPLFASGDWSVVETAFGPIPSEWRAFISAYGSGTFYDGGLLLEIFNPLDPAGRQRIFDHLYSQQWEFENTAEPDPPLLHPARPGSLPWGSNDQRSIFGFLTNDDPEKWTILCSVEGTFRQFDCGLIEFLLGTLLHEGPSLWFDSDVFSPECRIAYREPSHFRFYRDGQNFYREHPAEFPVDMS